MSEAAYILLGSNEGDRYQHIITAQQLIVSRVGLISQSSSIYETAAWGKQNQPDFLNQVIQVTTDLSPRHLLHVLLSVEIDMGRKRREKWGMRTIDCDILYYGNTIVNAPDLMIPHPAINQRRFTLVPLAEIAPSLLHPVLQQSSKELLAACQDSSDVKLFHLPDIEGREIH